MSPHALRALRLVMVASFASAIAIACGSGGGGYNGGDNGGDNGGGTNGGGGSMIGGGSGGSNGGGDSAIDPDAFFANDPPPMYCYPDGSGGTPPPPPGGTPDCPDDKNRQGCPCSMPGMTAPCWPGLRANRGLGICKDGMTTCVSTKEFGSVWDTCVGYVLPQPGATKGATACKCFSAGQWAIANLSPCFIDSGGGPGSAGAVSTYIDSTGKAQCPPATNPPMPQTGTTWSTDTLKVDCEGEFKLCYELKAGSAMSPQPSDCSLTKQCTDAYYPMKNSVFKYPDLPAWVSTDTACAQKFATSGGYGEMSVVGLSVRCDKVDDGNGNPYVFNRVQYCPLSCNTNPNGPGCMNCMQGGSGGF